MLKERQVVMLPSKNESNILKVLTDKMAHRGRPKGKLEDHDSPWGKSEEFEPYHLYFLSDERPKLNDWFYAGEGSKPEQAKDFNGNLINGYISEGCKKIIATTDESLEIYTGQFKEPANIEADIMYNGKTLLPRPSNSFISKYIKEYNRGNIITRVMLEYELIEWLNYGLKVDRNNEITISPVKSVYTREEVLKLLSDYRIFGPKSSNLPDHNKWIEQNL